uniref:neurabin-1-like isoform X2 n=1 Tax=Myxine glutinosa TaxID=7769 RepID=UPI00358E2A5B
MIHESLSTNDTMSHVMRTQPTVFLTPETTTQVLPGPEKPVVVHDTSISFQPNSCVESLTPDYTEHFAKMRHRFEHSNTVPPQRPSLEFLKKNWPSASALMRDSKQQGQPTPSMMHLVSAQQLDLHNNNGENEDSRASSPRSPGIGSLRLNSGPISPRLSHFLDDDTMEEPVRNISPREWKQRRPSVESVSFTSSERHSHDHVSPAISPIQLSSDYSVLSKINEVSSCSMPDPTSNTSLNQNSIAHINSITTADDNNQITENTLQHQTVKILPSPSLSPNSFHTESVLKNNLSGVLKAQLVIIQNDSDDDLLEESQKDGVPDLPYTATENVNDVLESQAALKSDEANETIESHINEDDLEHSAEDSDVGQSQTENATQLGESSDESYESANEMKDSDSCQWESAVIEIPALEEEEEEEPKSPGHKIRFSKEPMKVCSTFSNADYDRRNDSIDPISASAEYELEKRLEDMDIFPVELQKGEAGLGLGIYGVGSNLDINMEKLAIFVKEVFEGGAAHKDGRIKKDDQVVEVDDISMVGVSQSFSASVLRNTNNVVRFLLGRERTSEKPSKPDVNPEEEEKRKRQLKLIQMKARQKQEDSLKSELMEPSSEDHEVSSSSDMKDQSTEQQEHLLRSELTDPSTEQEDISETLSEKNEAKEQVTEVKSQTYGHDVVSLQRALEVEQERTAILTARYQSAKQLCQSMGQQLKESHNELNAMNKHLSHTLSLLTKEAAQENSLLGGSNVDIGSMEERVQNLLSKAAALQHDTWTNEDECISPKMLANTKLSQHDATDVAETKAGSLDTNAQDKCADCDDDGEPDLLTAVFSAVSTKNSLARRMARNTLVHDPCKMQQQSPASRKAITRPSTSYFPSTSDTKELVKNKTPEIKFGEEVESVSSANELFVNIEDAASINSYSGAHGADCESNEFSEPAFSKNSKSSQIGKGSMRILGASIFRSIGRWKTMKKS